ncbi:MAG: tetratricopeptide repeat protein [Bacteroidia bacterium]|nr:tetratricopeptide repeat protein [Bacteroidia bacterium]
MNNQLTTFSENKTKVYLALVLIPFCLYFKSIFYDFSPMDDQWMVIQNSDTLSDWKNIKTFFTKPLAGLYYRPLFSISLMLDFHIGKTNPFIYHLSNLIYHLTSVILLYKLFLALKVDIKTSFFLSLIFAVHPVLLHAIAWIPGRNDILLTIFTLGSALYLIKFLTEHKTQYIVFHLLFFICSVLTKENAIILPLFFTCLIYYFKQTKKTFFVFFFSWIIIILGWYFLRSLAVKSSLTLGADVLMSIKNFAMGILLYLGKSIIPVQQSVFPTLKNSSIIFGIVVLAVMGLTVLKFGVKNKILAILGVVLFFSMISIPVWYGATGSSGEHYEQRVYLPLIGLLLFISQLNFNKNSLVFFYCSVLVILIFSIKTFSRLNVYKNDNSFIEAGIKEAPEYYFFYAVKGDQLLVQQNYIASIPYYNTAIKMQPTRPQLYSSRGYAYTEIGKLKEAIDDFSKAIEYSKNNPDMYLNRCLAYTKSGNIEMAIQDLTYLKKNAPQIIPEGLEKELFESWHTIMFQKMNEQIITEPQNASLYVRRAKLFISKNNFKEALEDIKIACKLEPNNPTFKTYFNQLISRVKQ